MTNDEHDFEAHADQVAAYARQERAMPDGGHFLTGVSTGLRRWAEGMTRASAVAAFRGWVDEEHDVRPTRGELRGFGRHVLTELDRVTTIATERGDEIAKLHREVDALRAQRDEALEERDGWFDEHANVNDALDELGRERDELKRRLVQAQRERDSFRVELVETKRIRNSWQTQAQARAQAVTSLQERVETLADDLRYTEGELKRARESANARADYVLLRLAGSRPEVVDIESWDEDSEGEVTVHGHLAEGGVK